MLIFFVFNFLRKENFILQKKPTFRWLPFVFYLITFDATIIPQYTMNNMTVIVFIVLFNSVGFVPYLLFSLSHRLKSKFRLTIILYNGISSKNIFHPFFHMSWNLLIQFITKIISSNMVNAKIAINEIIHPTLSVPNILGMIVVKPKKRIYAADV